MAGEGDVHEVGAAQLVGGADDQIAAGNEVVVADQIRSGADLRQVLMGLAGDAQDVGPALLDLTERLCGSGDSLVDDDGLDVGIVSQTGDLLNGGLHLIGEVVGIGGQDNAVLAIHRLECLGAAAIVLRLRDGAGDDADLEGIAGGIGTAVTGRGFRAVPTAGGECQQHDGCQQGADYSFHTNLPFFISLIKAHAYFIKSLKFVNKYLVFHTICLLPEIKRNLVPGGGPHIKRWKKQKSKYSWNFIAAKPFGESLAYSRSP